MERFGTNILLGDDVLGHLPQLLDTRYGKVFALVDANTHQHCLPIFLEQINDQHKVEVLEVPAGETSKTLETAASLWRTLNEKGADRHALLINLGGGMITDLGGFVASVYKRGIDFIHMPTSLLGMVDASIGGKTGIDFDAVKNMIGTFKQPEFTIIYPSFLQTLPHRERVAGFAEVVKHGALQGKQALAHFTELWAEEQWHALIRTSAAVKVDIVANDFKEQDQRQKLNFGHTIGHAIESYFLELGSPILHGEAVAAGMLMEGWLSTSYAAFPATDQQYFQKLIRDVFPVLTWPEKDDERILKWLQFDKKNRDNSLRFVALNAFGDALCNVQIALDDVALALRYYRKLIAGG